MTDRASIRAIAPGALLQYFVIAFLIFACPLGAAARAATPPATTEPASLPPFYPFTPEELWAKLLQVITLPDGQLTPESVGARLNVNLRPMDATAASPAPSYAALAFKDSYFDVIVQKTSTKRFSFVFGWGHDPRLLFTSIPQVPPDMCLGFARSDALIRRADWVSSMNLQHESEYTRSGISRLILTTDRNQCLNAIVIRDDPVWKKYPPKPNE